MPLILPTRRLRAALTVIMALLALRYLAPTYAQDAGTGSELPRGAAALGKDNGRSAAAIAEVVRAGLPDVQRCYADVLAHPPNVRKQLAVDIFIAPAGNVVNVRTTKDELNMPLLGVCIHRVIRAWKFKLVTREGIVRVSCPLDFQPGEPSSVANLPPPAHVGSEQEYVARFGACAATWRPGVVPSQRERQAFERSHAAAAEAEPAAETQRYLYQLETCYARALEVPTWAKNQGTLSLRLAIAADGRVVAARAVSETLAPALVCCAQNAAMEWTFANSAGFRVAERAVSMTRHAQGSLVRFVE